MIDDFRGTFQLKKKNKKKSDFKSYFTMRLDLAFTKQMHSIVATYPNTMWAEQDCGIRHLKESEK